MSVVVTQCYNVDITVSCQLKVVVIFDYGKVVCQRVALIT